MVRIATVKDSHSSSTVLVEMPWQKDVKRILGDEMYRKLQGFVRECKISKSQAKYVALGLHPNVGGSFVHKMNEHGFAFDDSTFMEILGDYISQSEKAQQDKLPDKIIEILK